MDKTKIKNEADAYLESIGGLKSCYKEDSKITNSDFFGVGYGWYPLIKELIEDLLKLGWDKQICQIKEKFGGLRFYIGGATEEVFQRISKAENQSYTVCENCGKPGTPNEDGNWIKTLCDSCRAKRNKAMS